MQSGITRFDAVDRSVFNDAIDTALDLDAVIDFVTAYVQRFRDQDSGVVDQCGCPKQRFSSMSRNGAIRVRVGKTKPTSRPPPEEGRRGSLDFKDFEILQVYPAPQYQGEPSPFASRGFDDKNGPGKCAIIRPFVRELRMLKETERRCAKGALKAGKTYTLPGTIENLDGRGVFFIDPCAKIDPDHGPSASSMTLCDYSTFPESPKSQIKLEEGARFSCVYDRANRKTACAPSANEDNLPTGITPSGFVDRGDLEGPYARKWRDHTRTEAEDPRASFYCFSFLVESLQPPAVKVNYNCRHLNPADDWLLPLEDQASVVELLSANLPTGTTIKGANVNE